VIYDELSLLDAPKWCTGFSQNPVLKHLLEHPFFFRHKIQRIIQARILDTPIPDFPLMPCDAH
jgi:hypothetical protein